MELLLSGALDPEVSLGSCAEGGRVGPGVQLPRLRTRPTRNGAFRNNRIPSSHGGGRDGRVHMAEQLFCRRHTLWRVYRGIGDQSKRGQVLKLSEEEARSEYPNLVVASLGANKKEKPRGIITARVLHDGTNGISVNRRIRVRDQERFPTATDVKRVMREKATIGEQSIALTADKKEAHRQVPIDPGDWHLLACQVTPGSSVYIP